MKRILVPTDFSDCAHKASKNAIEIAKKSGAKIHFLHFMSIPINWIQMEKDQDLMYPDITKEVNNVKHQLKELTNLAKIEDVAATYYLGYNESYLNIIKYIKENDISLVIMGSHGAGGFKELFMGSNAQKVVRLSDVPVLIIKDDTDITKIQDVIFLSDFEPENMVPFENLLTLIEVMDAKIHLVYINTPSYFNDSWEIEEKMEAFKAAASDNLGQCRIIDTYVFEDGLDRFAHEFATPMITMATHGRTGVSRVFYGSMTEKVVNHIQLPVLSLKIPKEKDRHKELQLEYIS